MEGGERFYCHLVGVINENFCVRAQGVVTGTHSLYLLIMVSISSCVGVAMNELEHGRNIFCGESQHIHCIGLQIFFYNRQSAIISGQCRVH